MSRPSQHASHLGLIDMSRSLQRTALEGGTDAVHRQLRELRTALADHLDDEQARVEELPPPARGTVLAGQCRLIAVVDHLVALDEKESHDCTCHLRAVDLTQMVARQARLETDMLEGR